VTAKIGVVSSMITQAAPARRKEFIVYAAGPAEDKLDRETETDVRPLLFLIAFAAAAAFAADRPNLNGTWQLSSHHEARLKFETLLIEQTPDGVKISESGTKEKTVDIACGVDGHECKLKEGEISLWYNGPALVMMEMHHNRDVVTKTRLVLSEDGNALNLEVIHVSPPGSSSTYTFKKQL